MIDFDSALSEYDLNQDQYESVLKDIEDKFNGLNDYEWRDITAKYNLPISDDTLRKANGTIFGGRFVREWTRQHDINNDYDSQMSEIRKERQKLFDERAALNKINRDNARIEHDLEYLETLIKNTAFNELHSPKVIEHNNSDLLIALSDIHLGLNVSNNFGAYNTVIAQERMNDYLSNIVSIKKRHNSENAYLALLGDEISGAIHTTVQLENRENVIEQIQKVSEMIASFAYSLSGEFANVYINSVGGNHSRINQNKDKVMRDERLDDLILWYLKAKLSNLSNVYFEDENNYDSTIGKFDIRGNEYLLLHGDFDSFSEAGISKLVMMIGHKPTAILMGHLHRCSLDDIANVKIIRSGCFSGTADDYVVSNRISGHPSQMVCVVGEKGIETLYPVDLG